MISTSHYKPYFAKLLESSTYQKSLKGVVSTSKPILPKLLVANLKTTKSAQKFPPTTAPDLEQNTCLCGCIIFACMQYKNRYNRTHIHKIQDCVYIYKEITLWGPSQDAPFNFISWYVLKTIYFMYEQDQFVIQSSYVLFNPILLFG